MNNQLIEELENWAAVIGILGLGYMGLPLMVRCTEVVYKVLGIDIDASKVDKLMQGQSYIEHNLAAKVASI
jgi:UDP-N-acetyl-D-glucosamine dehydrogenase